MRQFNIYRDSTKAIYADDIPQFPASNYWGNLSNKILFMFYRLNYMNQLLDSIFSKIDLYNQNFKLRNGENNHDTTIVPYIEIIHVISDLRMIIDEMVALLYILETRERDGDYPQVIHIDSIGELLKALGKGNSENIQFFVKFKDYLKLINDISNTYKHSFLNDHIIFHRQINDPTVLAIKATNENMRNKFDLSKNRLITTPLEDIVANFVNMFNAYLPYVRNMAHQQIIDSAIK